MEMVCSTISNLRSSFDDKISFPTSMVVCFGRMILDLFSWLLHGGLSLQYLFRLLRPHVNDDSHSRIHSDVHQAIRLLFPGILVFVFFLLVIEYFNGCARACSLDIAD
jgi:hypothetical protein